MASAVIDLPFGTGRRFLSNGFIGKVVGGFQLTVLGQWQPGAMEQFSSTLYFIGPSISSLCSGPHTLAEWFNPADFVTNSSLVATTGQARTFPNYINACRGEALAVANASASRNFKINERFNLQFRWDVYNITNHSEFSPPNASSPTASNFGEVTTTVNGGGGTPTLNRSMRAVVRIVF
jgi:hypothetical protein